MMMVVVVMTATAAAVPAVVPAVVYTATTAVVPAVVPAAAACRCSNNKANHHGQQDAAHNQGHLLAGEGVVLDDEHVALDRVAAGAQGRLDLLGGVFAAKLELAALSGVQAGSGGW